MKQYTITDYDKAFEAYKQSHEGATNYDFWRLLKNAEAMPIGSKQAWILTEKDGSKYLQSYHTIVSMKFVGEEIQSLGKWSRTTSNHQRLFWSLV